MRLAGFEPAIPAIERLPTYALYRATTGIGSVYIDLFKILHVIKTYRNISHYVLPHMRQFPSSDTFSPCTLKRFAFCHPNKTLPHSEHSWPVIGCTLPFTVYPTYILKISHLTPCSLKTRRAPLRCPPTTSTKLFTGPSGEVNVSEPQRLICFPSIRRLCIFYIVLGCTCWLT